MTTNAADMHTPWSREALDDLLVVLSAGLIVVATIEVFECAGLWDRLLSEWVQSTTSRPATSYTRGWWTVNLVETTFQAALMSNQVARLDLLELGALLHDIGKGRGTGHDHSVIGRELIKKIGCRLGTSPVDVKMLATLITVSHRGHSR